MPTYEYKCTQCKHSMEVFQKITEDALKLCPNCGHETLRRGPGGGIGVQFHGSGFYKNDYAPSKPTLPIESNPTKSSGCCPCGKNKGSCGES